MRLEVKGRFEQTMDGIIYNCAAKLSVETINSGSSFIHPTKHQFSSAFAAQNTEGKLEEERKNR